MSKERFHLSIHKIDYEGHRLFTPEILIFSTPTEADQYAAAFVMEQIDRKPNSVLTLPTGPTPQKMYEMLVQIHKKQALDMSHISVFNLDEYWPIRRDHPSSYTRYMQDRFISHINIHPSNWHIPDGEASDPYEEAIRYEKRMKQSPPVDLAVVGIGPGTTCHIGFNEKGSPLDSRVRYVSLDEETLRTNRTFFDKPEEIPHGAITQGVATILDARKIILIAKGKRKAWGVHRAFTGPIGPAAPASFLRLHQQVTVVLDQDAGKLLSV